MPPPRGQGRLQDADHSTSPRATEMSGMTVMKSAAPGPVLVVTHPTSGPGAGRPTTPTGPGGPGHRTPPASRVRPPGPWVRLVERRRLLDQLSRAVADAPFTLISAPAGCGKTVLASTWAEGRGRRRAIAWLTVTDQDEQPAEFWSHVGLSVAMMGAGADPLPSASGAQAVDDVCDLLLGIDTPVVLVVDAADRLRNRAIFDQLGQLLDDTGGRLRLIMTTRADPPMALHRYRLEGSISEIRYDELAFNSVEADGLLNLHGLTLSGEAVQDVMDRTEGWAAGVRLAALAMQYGGSRASLGDLAADYLVAEVLSDLDSADRDFLRALSLIEQIPPALGCQVTGRTEADELLRQMCTGNTFVQLVRGRPGHYRIHPLVRTVLAYELAVQRPAAVADVHRSAADWFYSHGQLGSAVEHAAAGGDWRRAARFVLGGHAVWDLLLVSTRGSELIRHLWCMPDLDSADVRLVRAAVAAGNGDLESARAGLARCVTEDATGEDWLLSAAVMRTWLSAAAGQAADTLLAAGAAREQLIRQADRGGAQLQLLKALVMRAEGTAHLCAGDLDVACQQLRDAMLPFAASCNDFRLHCLATLALAEVCRGHLSTGEKVADTAEQLAVELAVPTDRRPAGMQLAHAWVALERQDLSRAEHFLRRSGRSLQLRDDALLNSVSTLLQARLSRDRGDLATARSLLERPEPIGWLRVHRDTEIAALGVPARCVEPGPDATARVDPCGSRPEPEIATTSQRVLRLLERAQYHSTAGELGAGRKDVAEALSLGAGERIRRPFAHLPGDIRAMIRTDPELRSGAGWLLPEAAGPVTRATSPARQTRPATAGLSERELEVLRLLSALLTTEEIAAALFISVNTVRTHVRRILEKLCVSRRGDAVRRARQLNLV